MPSVCTVQLHVTINNLKIVLSVAETLLRRNYVAGNNKTYLGLHVKSPTSCLSDFNQIWSFAIDLH